MITLKTGITQVLVEPQQKFFHQHWAQKWTKTVNFGYALFLLKHKIFKDCSNTVFFLWETTSCQNVKKIGPYLGKKGLRTPPVSLSQKKGHFMDTASPQKHLKIYNLIITNVTLIRLTAVM